jgi:hypothetical protein
MKRILHAAIAAIFALSITAPALANRVVVYPAQTPTSNETNQQPRNERVALGTLMRDFLGSSVAAGGTYANLSVIPGTGLFVAVKPPTTNTLGSLYQLAASDAAAVPTGYSPSIPADPTIVVVQGLQSTQSPAIGPLTAPGAGNSVYYLVEAQVQTAYTTPLALQFVNSSGSRYTQTVNTSIDDQIVYQTKGGTPAPSPTVPTVDSGWIAVGTVLVPSSTTQITSGMIAMLAPFPGFLTSSNSVALTATPAPPQTGNAAISGTLAAGTVSGSTLTSTVATGTPPLTVASTTLVANLNAATAGTLSGINPTTHGGTGTATPIGVTPGASGNFTCSGAFALQTCDTVASPTFTTLTASTGVFSSARLTGLVSQPCVGTDGSGNFIIGTCSGGGGSYTFNATSPLSVTSGSGTVTYACTTCLVGLTNGTGISTGSGTSPSVALSHGDYVSLSPGGPQSGSLALTGAGQFSTVNLSSLISSHTLCTDGSNNATTSCGGLSPTFTGLTLSGLTASKIACTDSGSAFSTGCSGITPTFAAVNVTGAGNFGGAVFSDGATIGSGVAAGFHCGTASVGCVFQDHSTFTTPGMSFDCLAMTTSTTANCYTVTRNNLATTLFLVQANGNATAMGSMTAASFVIPTSGNPWGFSADGTPNLLITYNGVTEGTFSTSAGATAGAGYLTAEGFYSLSRREYKQDITPIGYDGLDLLHRADWACWRYLPKYGDPTNRVCGYIANDSPEEIAGTKHDHSDALALSVVDAQAILQLEGQVHLLYGIVAVLALIVLGFGLGCWLKGKRHA